MILSAGIVSLASFGIFNTADAFNGLEKPQVIEPAASVDSSFSNTGSLTGDTCSPYGCAGCAGCSSIQYQPNVEITPAVSLTDD